MEDRTDNWRSIINLQPLELIPEQEPKSPDYLSMMRESSSSENTSFKTDEEGKDDSQIPISINNNLGLIEEVKEENESLYS